LKYSVFVARNHVAGGRISCIFCSFTPAGISMKGGQNGPHDLVPAARS